MKLQNNQTIDSINGVVTVKKLLGEGGQGEVYAAELNGRQYALKVYKNDVSPEFKENLKNNIKKGSPYSTFLWPQSYVETDDLFGYLMDIRPGNYASFIDYLNGKVFFKNTRTMLIWCISLCQSMKKLHEHGLSYQDLNDGSFFFEPNNGDLLICDNDNVAPDQNSLGILGKMRYMAPEIVRGEKKPDILSDRFSLAVILFMTMCVGNPFEGARLAYYNIIDENAEKELFGTKPLFIYDPNDSSNRPIRGLHKWVIEYWGKLPSYIKDAFIKTFGVGLKDRENGRTTEIEWIRLLQRYSNELVTCSCGKQYIYGIYDSVKRNECPYCGKPTRKLVILKIGDQIINIEPDVTIYENQLDKFSSDYTKIVGKVITNPSNPQLMGIRLWLNHDVLIKDKNGLVKTISKNGVIPIVDKLVIKFDENIIGGLFYGTR